MVFTVQIEIWRKLLNLKSVCFCDVFRTVERFLPPPSPPCFPKVHLKNMKHNARVIGAASTIPVFYFCGIVTWQFSFRRSDPPSEWYQPIDVLFRSWVRVLQSGGKFAHIQVEVWEILSQRFMWSWLVKCGTNQCMDNHKKQVCIGTGTRCVVYFVNVWGEKKVISKWPNSESCWHRTSPKVGHF